MRQLTTAGSGCRQLARSLSSRSRTSPLRITDVSIAQSPTHEHHAFVAGLMPSDVNTAFFGRHASVQIYVKPLAAPRIFGVSGRDLAARVIGLRDLAPSLGNALPDRLAHAADWRERFEIVDSALLELWAAAAPPDPLVDWMWGQLAGSGGQVRIAELARRSGWSERHLSARLTTAVGVSPKQAAGVIRFERVHSALGGSPLTRRARDTAWLRRSESPHSRGAPLLG